MYSGAGYENIQRAVKELEEKLAAPGKKRKRQLAENAAARPMIEAGQVRNRISDNKRRQRRSTLLTGNAGIAGNTNIQRKTLLGQ